MKQIRTRKSETNIHIWNELEHTNIIENLAPRNLLRKHKQSAQAIERENEKKAKYSEFNLFCLFFFLIFFRRSETRLKCFWCPNGLDTVIYFFHGVFSRQICESSKYQRKIIYELMQIMFYKFSIVSTRTYGHRSIHIIFHAS